MATLPDIGLNGLVGSVRKIGGYIANPGYRDVDSTAEFVAGMAAVLGTDSNGRIVLQVADNTSSTGVIGLFYCHKTVSFYRSVRNEEVVAPTDETNFNLSNANIKTGSIRMTTTADLTSALSNSSDYQVVSLTNGTLLNKNLTPGTTYYVSYMFKDPNLVGIDQTLGSGKAATLEDNGEVGTLVYDTTVNYVLNAPVYINADGYATSAAGAKAIGKITKPPTAEDPELQFKMILA